MFTDEMFNLSESKDLDSEVEKLFRFYRDLGYPNYDKSRYDISKELKKLQGFDTSTIVDGKTIRQNMLGCGILWTYFPHWIEVKCSGAEKSLKELWEDDEQLKTLIRKTYVWKLKHNEPHWTHNRIRQNAKVFLSKQSVSNFRPTVAKYIYDTYGNSGDVLDMSGGFGGRMLGFYASNCNTYTCIEPAEKTFYGLAMLGSDLYNLTNKKCTISLTGSEFYQMKWYNQFDLCFTSPPYFDTEKYSDEPTQSYIHYPTLDLWLNGFLKDTINNCFKYTKSGGYTIINIADGKYSGLEEATIKHALDSGFEHTDTLYMELSAIAKNKSRKVEPIYVFRKN